MNNQCSAPLLDSDESLMLSAIELFHYSYKFREQKVVIAIPEFADLKNLLSDFHVLRSSHIQAILCVRMNQADMDTVSRFNLQGHRFQVVSADECSLSQKHIETMLNSDEIPVFSYPKETDYIHLCEAGLALSDLCSAIKFFYVQESPGLEIDGTLLSHCSRDELLTRMSTETKLSLDRAVLQRLCNSTIDIAIIAHSSGALFQELFTHRGSGTLLSSEYPNVVRKAQLSDISEITLLLTPYVQRGSLLAFDDDELIENIEDFHVYTVDSQIAAAARMKSYGAVVEIGKFCTLPRYQRRGRARVLAESLIDRAKAENRTAVFALSIEPSMWDFFLNLGFQECSFEDLPATWRTQYDSNRRSRAFLLSLDTE